MWWRGLFSFRPRFLKQFFFSTRHVLQDFFVRTKICAGVGVGVIAFWLNSMGCLVMVIVMVVVRTVPISGIISEALVFSRIFFNIIVRKYIPTGVVVRRDNYFVENMGTLCSLPLALTGERCRGQV